MDDWHEFEDTSDWDSVRVETDPFLLHHKRMVEFRESLPAYVLDPWVDVSDRRVQQLKAMAYKDYLLTPEWNAKRRDMLRLSDKRCERCGKENSVLHVHHQTYERLGRELQSDLEVLCRPCHQKEHGIAA